MVKRLLIVFMCLMLVGLVGAASIVFDYPVNQTYDDSINYFDWTYGGNVSNSTCWYSLDGGSTNNTMATCGSHQDDSINTNEGQNEWTIWVNDSGILNNTSVSFWVDSINPVVNWVLPATDPAYYASDTINLKVNFTETNPQSIEFEIYDSGNTKRFSLFDSFIPFTTNASKASLPDDDYMCFVTIIDTIGHQTKINITVFLDNVDPYYSNIQTQADNVYGVGKNYTFSIQWDDDLSGVDDGSVVFELEGTGYTVTNIGNVYYATVSDLAAGDYNYTWTADDNAGNSNTTGNLSYTVVQATPILSLDSNPSWSESYLTETSMSVSCPPQLTCNLYRDGASAPAPDTQTLGVGSYLYVYNTSGNQNYTAGSINGTLVINKISPESGMSVSGTSPIVYGTASDFQGTETNTGDSGCNYTLYANNTLVSNPDNIVYGYGIIHYVYNTSGCANYTAGSISSALTVTKAPQDAELSINDTNMDYGEAVLVTCNGTLYRDGDNVSSENNTAVVLGAGTYNYTCTLEETANFSADSESEIVTVNKLASSVKLYLNGNDTNISVAYQEFFLIEGNVSSDIGSEDGQAELWANGILITPVNKSQPNVSTDTFMLSGTYNITVTYESQNYSSSSDTLFVTVAQRSRSSSGGGSCRTIYNCTLWNAWSACIDGEQLRTCLERVRVRCGDGNTSQQLDFGEVRDCVPYVVEEIEEPPQEGEPIIVHPQEDLSQGAPITGGVIGFLKSGTGIITILTLLVLAGAYGVVHYKRTH